MPACTTSHCIAKKKSLVLSVSDYVMSSHLMRTQFINYVAMLPYAFFIFILTVKSFSIWAMSQNCHSLQAM